MVLAKHTEKTMTTPREIKEEIEVKRSADIEKVKY